MFAKPLAELDYSDISNLVFERKEKEGQHLDYKSQPDKLDNFKRILTKEVSSFANSYGGYLILGINDNHEISGIVKEIQNTPIIEWINQVLSSRIEPPVFYYDPVPIEIPNSDKILIVIHIPESSNKPHSIADGNHYYLRINDSSKIANHYQIRDMFDFSRNRSEEFNDFLKRRNLFDEEDPNFGINPNSKRLTSHISKVSEGTQKPFVLISFIPKSPKLERINPSIHDYITWFEQNKRGYFPVQSKDIVYSSQIHENKIDGIVFSWSDYPGAYKAYYEFLHSGFFEIGFTDPIFRYSERYSEWEKRLLLTPLIGYIMLYLDFSKKYFQYIGYNDDVLIQISFIDVYNIQLSSFHHAHKSYDITNPKNTQHINFKLTSVFRPTSLTSEKNTEIAKYFSDKICRAFGLLNEMCFLNNSISNVTLNSHRF